MNKSRYLVVGSAGRIGWSVSSRLVTSGNHVIGVDSDVEQLKQMESELNKKGNGRFTGYVCDVKREGALEATLFKIMDLEGAIDGALYAAYPRTATWGSSNIENVKETDIEKDLMWQLGMPIIFARTVIECMRKSKKEGAVILVSSIQGIRAPKFEHYKGTSMVSPAVYAAVKGGLISTTKWLARYYGNTGIRVNCVSPGGIRDNQPESFQRNYRNDCCNIGMLEPNDISVCIVDLLRPEYRALTGQNIVIDDGWSL